MAGSGNRRSRRRVSRVRPKGLTVSEAFGKTFRVIWANKGAFLGLTLVVLLPTLVWRVVDGASMDQSTAYERFFVYRDLPGQEGLLIYAAEAFLSFLLMAGVVAGAVEYLAGESLPMGTCFQRGIVRLFPALGVSIVSGFLSLFILVGGILALSFLKLPSPLILVPYLLSLAATSWFFVAVPAAVGERRGVIGALKRSLALVKDRFFTVFLSLLAVSLLQGAVDRLLLNGLHALHLQKTWISEVNMTWVRVYMVLTLLAGLFFSLFYAALSAVIFSRLVEEKEKRSLRDLAKVFR